MILDCRFAIGQNGEPGALVSDGVSVAADPKSKTCKSKT